MTCNIEVIAGSPRPADLANAISDTIATTAEGGLELDVILSIVISVVADYARAVYDDGYLSALADYLVSHAGKPLPPDIGVH